MKKDSKTYSDCEHIARDLEKILNSDVSPATKRIVCNFAAWAWSQLPGKISKANHWSIEAQKAQKDDSDKIIFDHVVPRKVIIELLLDMSKPTQAGITDFLSRFCFGCIITKSEDTRLDKQGFRQKMPSGWDKHNPWSRYDSVAPKIEIPLKQK